jgi:hypothetical protein
MASIMILAAPPHTLYPRPSNARLAPPLTGAATIAEQLNKVPSNEIPPPTILQSPASETIFYILDAIVLMSALADYLA